MASKGKIWINMRSPPYKHGSGSFKDAFQAEPSKTGFDFEQVRAQLPYIRDPTQIAPNCVIIMFKIDPVTEDSEPDQTDIFMRDMAAEFQLQNRFAVDGYALPILGFIAKSNGVVVIEQYGIANILSAIISRPPYPLGSIDECFAIMLKCGFDKNGVVTKLFDSPPKDKQIIVDGVIDFINYAIDVQNILLVDFKPGNLCKSPFDDRKVVGLDFDPHFCNNVSPTPRGAAVMKAYMFLMFACIQYQFFPKDPNITIALHNGLETLEVAKFLDTIAGNQPLVNMFIHYLKLNPISPLPPITPIEVRDILRDRYIGAIATEAQSGGRKKKRNKTKHKKSKHRKSRRF